MLIAECRARFVTPYRECFRVPPPSGDTMRSPDLLPELPSIEQSGIGIIAPYDFALDRELSRWTPERVSLHITRLPYLPDPVTVRLAEALENPHGVHRATRDVLAPQPRSVVYACTSGSFVAGAAGDTALVGAMLDAGAPAATTTSGALVAALDTLGVRRVAVFTPYVHSVTERLHDYLREHGVHVHSSLGLGLTGEIWKLTYRDVFDAAKNLDTAGADAVFISCTNVPTYDLVAPLEDIFGIPVRTANQLTIWGALRAAGLADQPSSMNVRMLRANATG